MAPGLLQAEPYEFSSRNSISSGRSSPGHRGNGGNSDYITPIAVVGFSLEFPQDATSPEGFWNMLLEKRCASSEIPKDRLNVDAFHGIDKSRNDIVCAIFRVLKPSRSFRKVSFSDRYLRSPPEVVISFKMVYPYLTPLSFPFLLPRLRLWIHSRGKSWSAPIERWKTVLLLFRTH